MIIALEYKSGRIKEFDTSSFTSPEALRAMERGARNSITEFDLRLDKLDTDGLFLDVFWHDLATSSTTRVLTDTPDADGYAIEMPIAQRRPGCSIRIANPVVMQDVARIVVQRAGTSDIVAWRQGTGNWLINGARFSIMRALTYTDASTTSINATAIRMYGYLHAIYPDMTPKEICDLMGYPYEAYDEVRLNEMAQGDGSELTFGGDADEAPAAPVPPFPQPDSQAAAEAGRGESAGVPLDETDGTDGSAPESAPVFGHAPDLSETAPTASGSDTAASAGLAGDGSQQRFMDLLTGMNADDEDDW